MASPPGHKTGPDDAQTQDEGSWCEVLVSEQQMSCSPQTVNKDFIKYQLMRGHSKLSEGISVLLSEDSNNTEEH